MMKCWQEDPDARPTFADLRNQLKEMENQHKVNKIRTKLFSAKTAKMSRHVVGFSFSFFFSFFSFFRLPSRNQ